MATYAAPSDVYSTAFHEASDMHPMDAFEQLMNQNPFDPVLVDLFDPHAHAQQQGLPHFPPPSGDFFSARPKAGPPSYYHLPSAPHSADSSRTHSPSYYDLHNRADQWPRPDMVGGKSSLPPIETNFGFGAFPTDISSYGMMQNDKPAFGVDPSLIQQLPTPRSAAQTPFVPERQLLSQVPSLSPSASVASSWSSPQKVNQPPIGPLPSPPCGRPTSVTLSRKHSIQSHHSRDSQSVSGQQSGSSVDGDSKERNVRSCPECGKTFKDLKAHMLTHQNERPEKCPITSCDFHKRGFARKYDRNRHLVTTHYKATVVCGFCPGEGTSSEKTFNRTDVFKRHLVAVHSVDQSTSANKKRTARASTKSPTSNTETSGRCTTCANVFSNAQELFDHLEDCILAVVTQTDPSETANEKNLRTVIDDDNVHATMKRHSLPDYPSSESTTSWGEDDDGSEHDDNDGRPSKIRKITRGESLSIVNDSHVAKIIEQKDAHKGIAGVTYSKGGVDLAVGKGRRRRKHYPQSWGSTMEDMTLKKRVLCVFDGQRRLAKDDMMLAHDLQSRVDLPEGGWVTDLDVETMKRAEAFHGATEEERGPWNPTNFPDPTLFTQQELIV